MDRINVRLDQQLKEQLDADHPGGAMSLAATAGAITTRPVVRSNTAADIERPIGSALMRGVPKHQPFLERTPHTARHAVVPPTETTFQGGQGRSRRRPRCS